MTTQNKFAREPLRSSAKAAVVTGGTDGIGRQIALGLAHAGHPVIVVGRDREKGARAESELRAITGNPAVLFMPADLSLMSDVHQLAKDIQHRCAEVGWLVLAAGVVQGKHELTAEGIETHFALNFLGRFALALELLPLLQASGAPGAAARIVIVGGAAQGGKIHFSDINLTLNFSVLRAVAQFCEANDLFTLELARRLTVDAEKPRVTITTIKPGAVKTNIRRRFPWWMKIIVPLLIDPFLGQTPEAIAGVTLPLLLGRDFEGVTAALFLKIRTFKRVTPKPRTADPIEARRLWTFSQDLLARSGSPQVLP